MGNTGFSYFCGLGFILWVQLYLLMMLGGVGEAERAPVGNGVVVLRVFGGVTEKV